MSRPFIVPAFLRAGILMSVFVVSFTASFAATKEAKPAPKTEAITGQDANGHVVTVNGKGHYTVVLYTNPDLEEASRKVTLALDPYRSRSNFAFVRVVDFRGGVPPEMRSIVRVNIRKEITKEDARLKKDGVSAQPGNAPIIPDFTGSTLDDLGWNSIYETIRVVIFDTSGHEVKRLDKNPSASEVKQAIESVM